MLRSTISSNDQNQSGQVAVVILLVVVVLATLGLSQLSQTTEDLFISSQREESTRVFNAAESGVEEALSEESNFVTGENQTVFNDELDDSSVNVTVSGENDLETSIVEGETATVQLSGSAVAINWDTGSSGCDAKASLMLSVYNDTNNTARYIFVEPDNCAGSFSESVRNSDGFLEANAGSGDYGSSYSFTPGGNDALLRITALYAPTDLLVSGAGTMQAHTVRSTAETTVDEDAENTIQQIIEVQRSLPAAPSFMNYALYTNGGIVRNVD